MTETPNHGYKRPSKGRTDWHVPLNENFEQIDADVEIRDTEANKGDYEPKTGAKYEATDSGAIYYGNGSSWVLADREAGVVRANEAVFSNSDQRTGALLVDRNGDYRSVSFVTDEYWTHADDAGIVLQSLVDAIRDARGSDTNVGEIVVGSGGFSFDTPVVLNNHRGTTISGQSFRQSNGQSGTRFGAGNLPAGRGIIELGNIGDTTNPGNGEATHIKNIYMNLGGGDIAGIYNWAQDRVRTSDVKIENPGPNGNGIVYMGSFNSNIVNSYFDQAAFVKNNPLTKDTNSLRLHNVTFNTNSPGHPPLLLFSQGCRITNGIFNGVDGPNMNDGLAIVSDDVSLTGILGSDSRVSLSQISGQVSRIQFASCAFVTGGNDVHVFKNLDRGEFSACRFSSSGIAIHDFTRSAFTSCRFTGIGKEALYRGSGGGGTSAIVGCTFKNFGQNSGEPAIRFESSQNHRVTVCGNAFRSTNGASNDIILEDNANSVLVTGNWCADGISASIGTARIGSPRDIVSKVVGNSVNPIGFSRPNPSLPVGTGSTNAVANLNAQGAWVYHDGSGVNINSFGTITSLSTDPNPVFVPRAGEIYFDSAIPSAWDWWWV